MTGRPWTDAERARLTDLRFDGWTLATIAGELGRSLDEVRAEIEAGGGRLVKRKAGRAAATRRCTTCGKPVENDAATDFRRCEAHRDPGMSVARFA